MGAEQQKSQARTAQIGVRVTEDQYELIHDLAAVLGTSASTLVYEHGVEKAERLAREAQERFARRIAS